MLALLLAVRGHFPASRTKKKYNFNMQSALKWIIAAIVLCVVVLYPVKVRCGIPGASCAMPPQNKGEFARWHYEVEPLGLAVLESIIRVNLPIYYSQGIDVELR